MKQFFLFFFRHKVWLGSSLILVVFIIFIIEAIYRGYFLISSNAAQNTTKNVLSMNEHSSVSSSSAQPTSNPSPSDSVSPTDSAVLGVSDSFASSNTTNYSIPTSPPVVSPTPTSVPVHITAPVTSSSNNSSGNQNCTTGAGVPNSWYSDVYPASPVSASNGSVTLTVDIRDCNKNDISSSSTLKISLNSGDSSTQINGNNLPFTLQTQNGKVSFTVTSQNNATDNFVIQDTTDSFTVTDPNNNNPTVNFRGSSAAITSTPTPTESISPTKFISPTQSVTSTPTVIPDPTPMPTH